MLVGGLILGASSVVTQAANRDDDRHQVNPFDRILHKLDKILDAVKDGGSQDGNHTLRWDMNHPSASRFVKLAAFNNEAVLDKNTGLVWEQAPDFTERGWNEARIHCAQRTVGGTRGWRLPSIIELKSIEDPSLPAPFVPTTIFSIVPAFFLHSASSDANDPSRVLDVKIPNGAVATSVKDNPGGSWCVRGPMQESEY